MTPRISLCGKLIVTVALANCGSGTIAFTYLKKCLNDNLVKLFSRFCELELREQPWECVLSGIKISEDIHYSVPRGCTYFEISQGYYIGLLPGYIDAQCINCGEELRCRYSLQKKVCSGSGTLEVAEHLGIEQVKELVAELLKTEGDLIWCITKDGELRSLFLSKSDKPV